MPIRFFMRRSRVREMIEVVRGFRYQRERSVFLVRDEEPITDIRQIHLSSETFPVSWDVSNRISYEIRRASLCLGLEMHPTEGAREIRDGIAYFHAFPIGAEAGA